MTHRAPKKVEFESKSILEVRITEISAGMNHSAAVTSSGEMYTWGWGEFGRLGHGDEDMR